MLGKNLLGMSNGVLIALVAMVIVLCQGQSCPISELPININIEGFDPTDLLGGDDDCEGDDCEAVDDDCDPEVEDCDVDGHDDCDPEHEDCETDGEVDEECDPAVEDCDFVDSDGDGIDDVIDSCPETGADEVADEFGCSCEDDPNCVDDVTDSDADGVGDVLDSCPQTGADEVVDEFGCSVNDV